MIAYSAVTCNRENEKRWGCSRENPEIKEQAEALSDFCLQKKEYILMRIKILRLTAKS